MQQQSSIKVWDIGVRLFHCLGSPLFGIAVKPGKRLPSGNSPFDNECNNHYREAQEGFHWLPEHDG